MLARSQKVMLPAPRLLGDGGHHISYPNFAKCISDGETVGEALANGADALQATIATLRADKLPVPQPGSGGVASL